MATLFASIYSAPGYGNCRAVDNRNNERVIVIHSSDTDDAVSSHFLEALKSGRRHQMKHERNRKTVYQCKSVKEDDDNDVNDGKTMTSTTGRR